MHSTRRTLLSALGIAGAIALTATACSSAGDGENGGDGLNVVATTTQMGDIARTIAGDDANVTQLLQPGASAHGFDPTPASLQTLARADAVVMNGAGLEDWLAPVLESSGFDGVMIDASAGIELSGDHEDHEDHGEDDHDHEADPHLWTDPANVIVMAETIGDQLAQLDEGNAATIGENTDDYVEQLEALQQWMGDAFAQVPVEDRLLVTSHDSFHYLAEAYDIAVVGSLLPSFDDNAEVSAAAIDRLVADIRDTGARAIFSESQLPADLANTIAEEADVEVYSGEESLYTDSLGAEGSPGETYIGSQIHNTRLMVEAWGGGEAPELPDVLQ
ncbi:MAG TPA: metal ABC transporter substrate-binding protein [Candidatus Agrococcus pullicola]|uniref:Metal ABC transporter substrate-binding protein n=1 Tax=Candidatus Agrococcus pullicola TaxID=2838429 RepID=A0A9D2CA60_9MICO|nr:metal ABC transporter substrate-binding protein [Candidatus Agrococcus pullicola]